MNDHRWLNDDEQAAWRAWLEVMRVAPAVLEEGLHSRDNLNLTDYQVLVQLSESAEGRLRMTELSQGTHLSKSRLSHQIRRMEEAGLVGRADCPDDRRGSFAEITEKGLAAIRSAAPEHVEDVRRIFFDRLTPEQIAVLGQAMIAIAEGMRPQCHGSHRMRLKRRQPGWRPRRSAQDEGAGLAVSNSPDQNPRPKCYALNENELSSSSAAANGSSRPW